MKTRNARHPNRIAKDLHELKDDVARLYSDLTQIGKSQAAAATSKIGSLANDRLDDVALALKNTRGRGRDAIASVQRKVEENPIPSLLISFGVGFIIGKLLRRR